MYNQPSGFPIDRLLVPPMPVDPNRPPVTYQITCAPWLAPYVNFITGMIINTVTQEAQGPISIHLYNNLSQNNWANKNLELDVANCADFVHLQARGVQDPNQLPNLVMAYVSLRKAYEVKLFPGLRQLIDPQHLYDFDQKIAAFEMELQAIQRLRQGVSAQMGGGMPAPMPQAYPQPVAQAPMGAPMPYQTAPIGTMARGSAGAGRDYGNAAPTVTAPPQHTAQPVAQPVQQAAPQQQAAPAQPAQDQLLDPEETKWNPPITSMHPMLYNPVHIKLMYVLDANGKTLFKPFKTNMEIIDYDRHNIATLFGKPPENMKVARDNGPIVNGLAEAAKDALEESNNVDETGMRVEETMGMRNILSSFSLDTAIMDVRTEMMAKIDRAHPPMVFQAYVQIFTPIMGDKTEYELIEKFGDSSSYIELREKLRAAGGQANPALITDVSLKLTRMMNNILRTNLSILPEELEIGDFASDLEDLYKVLKTWQGGTDERLYRAFTKDQATRIKAMFQAPEVTTEAGKQLHDILTEDVLTASWNDRDDAPKFTFYGPVVRLSLIDALSHDLQLAGVAEVGNVITKMYSKVLYDLADSLFKVDSDGLLVAQQLVVTKDGRILEITQGDLIENTYLMHLVK